MEKKKVTVSVLQILEAATAINQVMAETGLGKGAYWLKRNLNQIEPIQKAYQERIQKEYNEQAGASEDGKKTMPPDKLNEFNVHIMKEASETQEEIEIFPLTFDSAFEMVLAKLPGSVTATLWWIFNEED